MEKEIEIMRVNKETVASISSGLEMVYDGDYEGRTTVTLKSGEKLEFSDGVVQEMFKKMESQEGFNAFHTLTRLCTEDEILEVAMRILRERAMPLQDLANSIETILKK